MQLSHRASIKRWLGVEKCDYIPNKWCKIVQIWKKTIQTTAVYHSQPTQFTPAVFA